MSRFHGSHGQDWMPAREGLKLKSSRYSKGYELRVPPGDKKSVGRVRRSAISKSSPRENCACARAGGKHRLRDGNAVKPTVTSDEDHTAEILNTLKRRRAFAAASGASGPLIAVLDDVIADLEAGEFPSSLRLHE
jgi:hypothetical protein